MNTKSSSVVIILTALMVLALGSTRSEVHGADWKSFSKGLNKALTSENLGLQKSAMRLVIKYGGEKLNVKASLNNVMKLYQSPPDKETRDLALLVIYQIDRKKAATLYLADLENETKTMRVAIDAIRTQH